MPNSGIPQFGWAARLPMPFVFILFHRVFFSIQTPVIQYPNRNPRPNLLFYAQKGNFLDSAIKSKLSENLSLEPEDVPLMPESLPLEPENLSLKSDIQSLKTVFRSAPRVD
ncbi:MAG: hypothetical protein Q7T18_09960 [Sedimentisphaerales bacterium]|nr:hypothetical protein [Sedimentisphaerales bacterium]